VFGVADDRIIPLESGDLEMETEKASSLRAALQPAALRAALKPSRPVFRNPWDSTVDMFCCYLAVSLIDPLLLFLGGEVTSSVFGFNSRWPLGVFMAAALVGAAGFMTIVGRERTSLSVDVLAITTWLFLGLVVAPILGLAVSPGAAIASYGVLLVVILVFVRSFGRWEMEFRRSLSWPATWSLLALFFAYSAHQLVLYS
jgi:hypothetical protein